MAGILGCRPREAAPAGDTGPRPVWAFGRSTETISCLWTTWMVKLLAPLETTRYGHMGRPEASVGRQHACTRGSPGLSEPAVCWPLLRTMLVAWVVAARPHVEDLACAGVVLEDEWCPSNQLIQRHRRILLRCSMQAHQHPW